jgi:hypothetical protein
VLENIKNHLGMIKRVFIEYHSLAGKKQTLDGIIKILTENNFRFFISSPGLKNSSPFTNIKVYNGMDMQLNIYGIKEEDH